MEKTRSGRTVKPSPKKRMIAEDEDQDKIPKPGVKKANKPEKIPKLEVKKIDKPVKKSKKENVSQKVEEPRKISEKPEPEVKPEEPRRRGGSRAAAQNARNLLKEPSLGSKLRQGDPVAKSVYDDFVPGVKVKKSVVNKKNSQNDGNGCQTG